MIQHSTKLTFLLILFSFNILSLSAQDSIVNKPRKNIVSYNYSFVFVTPWNQAIAYERSLNKHVSFHTMITIGIESLTNKYADRQKACFRIVPEVRYYFSNNTARPLMSGFYTGAFLYYQYQKVGDSDYNGYDINDNPVHMTDAEWKYTYWGGGISLGYQLHVLKSKRLIFDFNTGLQYSNITYNTNTNDKGNCDKNFQFSRFCSDVLGNKNFKNNSYAAIDPRIWLSIGYSF